MRERSRRATESPQGRSGTSEASGEHAQSERGTSEDGTRGRLLSWTVLRLPPPGVPAGRVVGLVELPDGRRVAALGEGEDGLAVDAEVELADDGTFRPVRR